jgi:hypothetical protein
MSTNGIVRLVLLRHGESTWNKENRFTGWAGMYVSVCVYVCLWDFTLRWECECGDGEGRHVDNFFLLMCILLMCILLMCILLMCIKKLC